MWYIGKVLMDGDEVRYIEGRVDEEGMGDSNELLLLYEIWVIVSMTLT